MNTTRIVLRVIGNISWPYVSRAASILVLLFFVKSVIAQPTVLTNALLISETNRFYDGIDLVINATTVTIDGSHSFKSLLLTNGAVLTHAPCTTAETHKVDITVGAAL